MTYFSQEMLPFIFYLGLTVLSKGFQLYQVARSSMMGVKPEYLEKSHLTFRKLDLYFSLVTEAILELMSYQSFMKVIINYD